MPSLCCASFLPSTPYLLLLLVSYDSCWQHGLTFHLLLLSLLNSLYVINIGAASFSLPSPSFLLPPHLHLRHTTTRTCPPPSSSTPQSNMPFAHTQSLTAHTHMAKRSTSWHGREEKWRGYTGQALTSHSFMWEGKRAGEAASQPYSATTYPTYQAPATRDM